MRRFRRVSALCGGWLGAAALAGCATTEAPPAAPVPVRAPVPAAPAEPAFLRADVMGASVSALDRLFGEPALVRREGAGEFRRYALADCALIVILYPDEEGRASVQRLDAAARRSGAAKPDLDACLARGLAG